MYNHLLYFLYWAINSLTIYALSSLFPDNIIIGNWKFNAIEAAIYSGFWVTFFIWCFWDFAIAKGLKFDSLVVTFGYFLLTNAFSFWLVSRFPQIAGFGISGYVWTFALGAVAYVAQRVAFKIVAGKNAA